MKYSLLLGSDCPFFLLNKPCFASGRGEILEPLELSLAGYRLVLINPGIHINTGWAFGQLKHKQLIPSVSLKAAILEPIQSWQTSIINDFEVPVFEAFPLLQQIKDQLYKEGALYAAMSGSGSSLFGLFDNNAVLPLKWPSHYLVKSLQLL